MITNLIDYVWVANNTLTNSAGVQMSFDIDFQSDSYIYSLFSIDSFSAVFDKHLSYDTTDVYSPINLDQEESFWKNNEFRRVFFKGGRDVGNLNLINWLEENGKLVKLLKTTTTTIPTITYSISKNGQIVEDNIRLSYKVGHNELVISYRSDVSLQYIEMRVTKGWYQDTSEENVGIGIGVLVDRTLGNISANEDHELILRSTPAVFTEGDGQYTVGIYARSAIDGSWNERLFLVTVGEIDYVPSDYEAFKVVTKEDIPEDQAYFEAPGLYISDMNNWTQTGRTVHIEGDK